VFRDYLSGLLGYVQKKIAAGEPKEKIVALETCRASRITTSRCRTASAGI